MLEKAPLTQPHRPAPDGRVRLPSGYDEPHMLARHRREFTMVRSSPIPTPVGLHDGNLVRYERYRDRLTAFISAWDNSNLTLVFENVWLVKEFDAVGPAEEIEGCLSDLRECFDSDLLAEARRHMENIHCSKSEMEKLRHYQLRDDSETPVLEVVSSGR